MNLKQALGRKSFLVIGRAGMDFHADPPGTPIEAATRFVADIGGSSANIAVGLARQGMRAGLLTTVSDDAVGRFCVQALDRYGVDHGHVRPEGGEARNSLAVVDTCGDATQAVIYRNGAADFAMTRADVAAVDYGRWGALIATGTVLASDPSRDAAFHAFALARAAGLALIFDVDHRPYSWSSPQEAALIYARAADLCDVIVGNDVEFGFMAGGYDKGLAKARALARNNGKLVVYKMGAAGAITIAPDGEFATGIFRSDTLKPTGAGDAFMAGFVAALARAAPLREAVLRGSACAAMVVARVGCAPAMPDTAALDDFIARHPGPTDPAPQGAQNAHRAP